MVDDKREETEEGDGSARAGTMVASQGSSVGLQVSPSGCGLCVLVRGGCIPGQRRSRVKSHRRISWGHNPQHLGGCLCLWATPALRGKQATCWTHSRIFVLAIVFGNSTLKIRAH